MESRKNKLYQIDQTVFEKINSIRIIIINVEEIDIFQVVYTYIIHGRVERNAAPSNRIKSNFVKFSILTLNGDSESNRLRFLIKVKYNKYIKDVIQI